MQERQRIVLYGDSLLLVAIRSCLAGFPALEVILQNVSPAPALSDFCAIQASVVIFDLAEFRSETVLSLIENKPDLLIIGLDSAGERMLLLSGQKAHTMTANRLVQLIDHLLHETGGKIPES
jgi:hypothetical protein